MSQNNTHTCLTKEEFDILIKDDTSRHDLERKLDSCQFCADAFEGYKLIDSQKRDAFLVQKISFPQPQNYRRVLKIAAAIMIGICLASILYNEKQPLSTDDIIAQYKPNENIIDLYTVRGEAIPTQHKEIIDAYDAKDYEKCSQLLEKIPEEALKPYFRLLRGISYFELDKLSAAKKDFDALEGQTPFWDDKVQYYKALIDIKNNDRKGAKTKLKIILQDPDNDYYTKAKDLLRKL